MYSLPIQKGISRKNSLAEDPKNDVKARFDATESNLNVINVKPSMRNVYMYLEKLEQRNRGMTYHPTTAQKTKSEFESLII